MTGARWYLGQVDEGRGGEYAIHCATAQGAQKGIARASTEQGYRVGQRSVSVRRGLPTPGHYVVPGRYATERRE